MALVWRIDGITCPRILEVLAMKRRFRSAITGRFLRRSEADPATSISEPATDALRLWLHLHYPAVLAEYDGRGRSIECEGCSGEPQERSWNCARCHGRRVIQL